MMTCFNYMEREGYSRFCFMTSAQLEVKLGANSPLEVLNAHIPKNC